MRALGRPLGLYRPCGHHLNGPQPRTDFPSVLPQSKLRRVSCCCSQQPLEIGAEASQDLQALRCGLNNFRLCLEDRVPVLFDQDTEDLTHAPTRGTNGLQTGWRGLQESNAAIAQDPNCSGISLKGFELEAREIKALQLLGVSL